MDKKQIVVYMSDLSDAQCVLLDAPIQPPGWRWDPETGSAHLVTVTPSWLDATNVATVSIPPFPPIPDVEEHVEADIAPPNPTLRMVSAKFAHIVAETLEGKRRVNQLGTLFDPASLKVLSDKGKKLKGGTVRLASVRVQPRSDLTAEVTLRLSTSTLDHAAALRVTGTSGHWMCTDLVMG